MGLVRIVTLVASAVAVSALSASGADRPAVRRELPAGIVAEADGRPLEVELFRAWLEAKGIRLDLAGADRREEVLRDFAVDVELARRARAAGLERKEAEVRRNSAFERRVLPEIHFRMAFQDNASVAESDFEPFFGDIRDLSDIKVAVLNTDEEARDFLAALKGGASFEALTAERSAGLGASIQGAVWDVARGDLRFTAEELDAVFSASPGDVVGPFPNKLASRSVIKVVARRTVESQKEAIRRERAEEIRAGKARAAYEALIDRELAASEVDINEEFFSGKKEGGGPEKTYVAWFRGGYIYPGDLGAGSVPEVHRLPEYRKSLTRYLRAVVATELAIKAGVSDLPEYRFKREGFLVQTLAAAFLDREAGKAKLAVTKKEIADHYKEYYRPEVFSTWIVLNADRTRVEAARGELLAGRSPSDVAKKYSVDPSRLKGGGIGYLPISAYDPAVRERIGTLKDGEVSEVFEFNNKFAIVRVLDRKVVAVPPIAQVEEKVRAKLLLHKRAELVREKRRSVLRKMSLTIDSGKVARL